MSLNVGHGPVIDLCAGIGTLAHAVFQKYAHERTVPIVCVELNPDYLAVGRKVLPEATWIQADVFDLPKLGHFECAIANPPFGAARRTGRARRYAGRAFEFHVLDIASDLADEATFVIPQASAPFRYSGHPMYSDHSCHRSEEYRRFHEATGIELEIGCSIDAAVHKDDWRDVAVSVEVVVADLAAARQRRGRQITEDLFVGSGACPM